VTGTPATRKTVTGTTVTGSTVPGTTVTLASVNVNGIRAAARKGMLEWIQQCRPHVIALQEVRAPDALAREVLGDGWHVAHAECGTKGRAGVAVASCMPIVASRFGDDQPCFAGTGRWVEADIEVPNAGGGALLTVISAYAHTGDETSAVRMAEKHAFFEAVTDRIEKLRVDGRHVVLTGDLNVAHRHVDLKNWKGNLDKAGFLPTERAHFDRWFDDLGWVDLGRAFGGDGPGPYTWWSYRGRAFDNDAGWRIDYLIASPGLAEVTTGCRVDRADTYASRWSDHAPVVASFAF
jgi:exodeoxyribonuclease III